MKVSRSLIAPLLAVGTAVTIAAAPIAAAADQAHQSCTQSGTGNSLCESPGNAQIVATPPAVNYEPWFYTYPYGTFIVGGGHHHHAMGRHH